MLYSSLSSHSKKLMSMVQSRNKNCIKILAKLACRKGKLEVDWLNTTVSLSNLNTSTEFIELLMSLGATDLFNHAPSCYNVADFRLSTLCTRISTYQLLAWEVLRFSQLNSIMCTQPLEFHHLIFEHLFRIFFIRIRY